MTHFGLSIYVSCFLCSCPAFCLSSAVPCSALLERPVAMLESRAETGARLLRPGYSVTRELCDDVSRGQSCIFTAGHWGEALSSWELDTGCRVLMAGDTGPVARAGTLVTPGAAMRLVTSLASVTTLPDVT